MFYEWSHCFRGKKHRHGIAKLHGEDHHRCCVEGKSGGMRSLMLSSKRSSEASWGELRREL